jgi:hypothetical protein
LINGNVFAPAEIRSMVSLLLHQGVKPITSISFSLDERFLNNTVIRYFDKIFASDYFSKDNDHEVKYYLNMVTNSKEMILNNVEKMKNHSNDRL